MNLPQRVACGFLSALCLGMLWGAMIIPAQAGDGAVQLVKRKDVPSESVKPGVPQGERPLYSPPVFMDRSAPISERPLAPISERPLAPIGGGAQSAPESVPFVWCQGKWVRADNPWHSCPSR